MSYTTYEAALPYNVLSDYGAVGDAEMPSRPLQPFDHSPFMPLIKPNQNYYKVDYKRGLIHQRTMCGPPYGRHQKRPINWAALKRTPKPFDRSPFKPVIEKSQNYWHIREQKLSLNDYTEIAKEEEAAKTAETQREVEQAQLFLPSILRKITEHRQRIALGEVEPDSQPDFTQGERAYMAMLGNLTPEQLAERMVEINNRQQAAAAAGAAGAAGAAAAADPVVGGPAVDVDDAIPGAPVSVEEEGLAPDATVPVEPIDPETGGDVVEEAPDSQVTGGSVMDRIRASDPGRADAIQMAVDVNMNPLADALDEQGVSDAEYERVMSEVMVVIDEWFTANEEFLREAPLGAVPRVIQDFIEELLTERGVRPVVEEEAAPEAPAAPRLTRDDLAELLEIPADAPVVPFRGQDYNVVRPTPSWIDDIRSDVGLNRYFSGRVQPATANATSIRTAIRNGAFILFPVASGQPAVYFTVSAAREFLGAEVAPDDREEIVEILGLEDEIGTF
jgi:hypothetical protein